MFNITKANSMDNSKFNINKVLCLGSGYVGVLTMTVFAHYHSNITFSIYDKYMSVIEKWNKAGRQLKEELSSDAINNNETKAIMPILEPKFEGIFKEVFDNNLLFISDLKEEVLNSEVIFICVNTPSTSFSKIKTNLTIEEIQKEISQGIQLNMNYVYSCVDEICQIILDSNSVESIFKERIIVQKSTVTLETLKTLHQKITKFFVSNKERLNKILATHAGNVSGDRKANEYPEKLESCKEIEEFVLKYFRLINIPEFLAEGSAMTNLINPDRVIIGSLKVEESMINRDHDNSESNYSKTAANRMKSFYNKWIEDSKIIDIDSNSSELIKLVSNAFLAQRVSSINSLSQLCEVSNGNINNLSIAVGMDERIGKNYLKASMGFGGSCLKKDVLSLIYILTQKNLNVEANYWMHVLIMNEYQRLRIANSIKNSVLKTTPNQSSPPTVSIFGLAFKGDIRDVRQSNGVYLISYLLENGINVNLYDPLVEEHELINELKLYQAVSDDVNSLKDIPLIKMYSDHKECVKKTQSLVLCSNHTFLKAMDMAELSNMMNDNCNIYDLYDVFSMDEMKKTNFNIFKLGECNQI